MTTDKEHSAGFQLGYAHEQLIDVFEQIGEDYAAGQQAYLQEKLSRMKTTWRQRLAIKVIDAAAWLSGKLLGE